MSGSPAVPADMDIRSRIRQRTPIMGHWISTSEPSIVEILAQSGADFLLLDGEHGFLEIADLPVLTLAAERHRCATVYRVRANRSDLIAGALDAGAPAIMVPMVNSAADARTAVGAAKYPPEGQRGIGPLRPSNYYGDRGAYVARANAATAIVAQIETVEAVADVEAIAATPGLDALYVGPADLTRSMTAAGRGGEVGDAIAHVARIGARAGLALGIDIGDRRALPVLIAKGFTFFTYGMDLSFVSAGGATAVEEFRAACDGSAKAR